MKSQTVLSLDSDSAEAFHARDSVHADNNNCATLPGFVTADFLIYYQRDDFRAQINLNNAFDKETYYATGWPNSAYATRGFARELTLSLRYEF